MVDRELMDRIKAIIREVDPEAEALLYGSRARGQAEPESDWDLVILLSIPVTEQLKWTIRHRLYEIEWEKGEVISCVIHSRAQWDSAPLRETPFRQRVSREAVRV
jgi:predicted nucleotidyltransferase